MTTESWRSFEVEGEEIEVVEDFSLLGALVECEGECEKEIRRRITLGKVAMRGLERIWKDKHVSRQTKTRIVNSMIFPVILYGCETWTETKAMEKKIDASEMWIMEKDAEGLLDWEENKRIDTDVDRTCKRRCVVET